jgi:hypothetical protein
MGSIGDTSSPQYDFIVIGGAQRRPIYSPTLLTEGAQAERQVMWLLAVLQRTLK